MVSRETISATKTSRKSIFSNDLINSFFVGGFSYKNLTPESAALFLLSSRSRITKNVCCVFKNSRDAFLFYQSCIGLDENCFLYFPKIDKHNKVPGFEIGAERYRAEVLVKINDINDYNVYICSERSFLSKNIPVYPDSDLSLLSIGPGVKIDREHIVERLLAFGFNRADTVYDPMDFALRGDIVDIFPSYFKTPVRIVLDFDKVESISYFNPTSQLTTKRMSILKVRGTKKDLQVLDYINFNSYFDSSNIINSNFSGSLISFEKGDQKHKRSLAVFTIDFGIKNLKKRINYAEKFSAKYKDVFIVGDQHLKTKFYEQLGSFAWIDGFIKTGFYSDVLNCAVISAHDIYNKITPIEKWSSFDGPASKSFTMDDISSLRSGDYVVHKNFGVGIFRGLSLQNNKGGKRESIEIEYKNNSSVFVSIEKMDLIHRYLGSVKKPKISRIGSKVWGNEIIKTKKAVSLVANELLSLYANKKRNRPFRYSKENDLGTALADSFPYIKTPDQERAIEDTLSDLDQPFPLDRLICGDVGFGKTEVALRAIMKVVLSGKQVVFLCPTTILADQHYITCGGRLKPLGISVGLLSRFKTKKEQKELIKRIRENKIDVLIGTHRVLSQDVVVPELGLLIIDEEHRFGVNQKEKIRTLKQLVDVLTLSATPIPRTLQHSLVGIRDISIIQTPPKTRKPIETAVRYFDWETIILYIKRELDRCGQVYFLHNDINGLPFITNKIRQSFPRSIVENIHGRLANKELEGKILSFFAGGIDVLVCTTIIESGIDVSNANCIIINDAQNFGLSQLYQIRGRVGRGQNQAYCLLLVPKKPLEKIAYRRLKTIEQFTSLGSGYNISMKDLEIRGAGSLFGYKQSGHISSVGFEMYCELLRDEINFIQGEDGRARFPDIVLADDALIEESYIAVPSQRLEFYNRLSRVDNKKSIEKIRSELKDRFGRLPEKLTNLLFVSEIRSLFKNTSIAKISVNKNSVVFNLDDIKPFSSIDKLIIGVAGFTSVHNLGHQFSEQKNRALSISFSTLNIHSSKRLSVECTQLFSVENEK